jgi:hypothetical protein
MRLFEFFGVKEPRFPKEKEHKMDSENLFELTSSMLNFQIK